MSRIKDYYSESLTLEEWLLDLSLNHYVELVDDEVCILPIKED